MSTSRKICVFQQTLIGTLVVRTSRHLTISEQKAFEDELVETLTTLEPGDVIIKPSSKGASGQIDKKTSNQTPMISVVESGFHVSNGYLFYSIILKNNSTDKAVELPSYRIVARNKDGALLGVHNHALSVIYPQQTIAWASQGFEVHEVPHSVEVEIKNIENYNISSVAKLGHSTYIPLEVKGARIKEGIFSKFIGEVYNPNNYDITSATVSMLFRNKDGVLLGGITGFCDGIQAGEKVPFEISIYSKPPAKDYQVYTSPWY